MLFDNISIKLLNETFSKYSFELKKNKLDLKFRPKAAIYVHLLS